MKRLLLVAGVLAAAACTDVTGGGAGDTRVYLTDAPFPYGSISAVNVYIARIEASASTDTTGLSPSQWVTIASPERTYNLLDFHDGAATLLGEAALPADQYAAVRVVINTGRSSVVRNDGSEATVHWPLGGDLALYAIVEQPLAVTGAGAQIIIDFDVGRTFVADSTGSFYFLPWIRAVNEAATGTISGTVTATSIEGDTLPFANAAVAVYRIQMDPFSALPARAPAAGGLPGGLPLGTAHTDAEGRYAVAYLLPGYYTVVATDPYFLARYGVKYAAQVTVGGDTRVDLLMTVDTTTGGTDTSGVPAGPVTRVTISPAAQTISVGDSAGAIATAYNAQNQVLAGRTVTWTVSDSTIVYVTQAAYNWILLRAARSGTVTLTATSDSISGTATVTVR